ncbi:MAG: ribosome small subunit-dependent GTPase A [Firmicutes bacterium]|nr:ribosome small subunit-dependent GTPase A [Bacillota bacterium]
MGDEILVGDRVVFQPAGESVQEMHRNSGESSSGIIEDLLPRKTVLIRPPVANVEQLVLVMSLQEPEPDWQLAGRILLMAGQENIEVFCCLNKIDLIAEKELESFYRLLDPLPYALVWSSAKMGTGIAQLSEKLQGRFSVFAGPSGAGKSSLLNAVQPGLALKTGEVSSRIGRGRHTTRHARLLPLDQEGFVVDTPGFSRVSLSGLDPRRLGGLFPEFNGHAGRCSFRDCNHIHEPDCAVREAVSAGEINSCRYEQYRLFWQELTGKER